MPSFDMARAWSDTLRLINRDRDLIYTIAAVFVFLPALIFSWVGPQIPIQQIEQSATTMDKVAALGGFYWKDAWPWMLGISLLSVLAQLTLIRMMVRDDSMTTSDALRFAMPIVPIGLILQVISYMLIAGGLLAVILPGILLIGRFFLAPAYLASGRERGAIASLIASWRATLVGGWSIAGFFLLVMLAAYLVGMLAQGLFGSFGKLVAGDDGSRLGFGLAGAVLSMAFAILSAGMRAAVFRQLDTAPTTGTPVNPGF